ncbi:MAG: hypothetical protein NNA20_10250 [Nitrospira sp.]|nr:hypothetical protein [Nitrospira sp.]MCP9442967.1 hypothetical protein [Nitrospira sp.]
MNRKEPFFVQDIQMNKPAERPALLVHADWMPTFEGGLQVRSSGRTSTLQS